MKTKLRFLPALTLALLITLQSCEKTSEVKVEESDDKQLVAHSNDEAMLSGEMDAITNDANFPLETIVTGKSQDSLVCSATLVYDTTGSEKKVTITYIGADCTGFRTRSGVVKISIPAGVRWTDVGAEVTVTYENLKITRNSDKKSITINGSHKLINVGGGSLIQLLFGRPNITHAVTSNNMSITFDDASAVVWQVARQRVYTLANGGSITITGTHQEGTKQNIAEWGTDRFGRSFTTSITEPLIISGTCQYRLVSGQIKHEWPANTATVTFGLDAQGLPVSCPSGSYYFKLAWTGTGGSSLTYIGVY
jgi:hypothetical protein